MWKGSGGDKSFEGSLVHLKYPHFLKKSDQPQRKNTKKGSTAILTSRLYTNELELKLSFRAVNQNSTKTQKLSSGTLNEKQKHSFGALKQKLFTGNLSKKHKFLPEKKTFNKSTIQTQNYRPNASRR